MGVPLRSYAGVPPSSYEIGQCFMSESRSYQISYRVSVVSFYSGRNLYAGKRILSVHRAWEGNQSRFNPGLLLLVLLFTTSELRGAEKLLDAFPAASQSGCVACHSDIELIRASDSEMMQQIMSLGAELGDAAGCIVCHNGDSSQREDKAQAHAGSDFYADPGSPWVNHATCGQCHQDQVRVQWQSLMMTEAGKIQGVAWAFGSLTGYEHRWAPWCIRLYYLVLGHS